jgi:hypothetical protein
LCYKTHQFLHHDCNVFSCFQQSSTIQSRMLYLMKTTKTQFLGKRLLIPLVLVEIATVGVGLSSPAHSTSLITLQRTVNAAKSQLIFNKVAEHNLLATKKPKLICIWVHHKQICWWR